MDMLFLHQVRHDELVARAADARRARACAAPPRRWALRLYARLWWASRPRAGAWPRVLLDGP